MPRLARLYLRHCAIGFALAAVFVAALLALDVGGLWHLVRSVEGGGLAVALLVVFNGIVFAGVQFALAVMGMAERPGGRGTPRRRERKGQPRWLAGPGRRLRAVELTEN